MAPISDSNKTAADDASVVQLEDSASGVTVGVTAAGAAKSHLLDAAGVAFGSAANPFNTKILHSSAASSVGLAGLGDLFLSTGMLAYSGLAISLTGTFIAAIEVFGSNDGGSTYFNLPIYSVTDPDSGPVTDITAPGLYFIKVTSDAIKISVTSYTSGTINGYFQRFTSAMDPSLNSTSIRAALYSSYSPDPANVPAAVSALTLDASGRLETHAAVTTDEGSFREDFPGNALTTALSVNVGWTAGSDQITGSNFFAELKAGDYVKKAADANTLYVRVSSVDSDTAATLKSPYAGTTAAAASVKSNWLPTIGAGSTITIASSLCAIAMPTTTGITSNLQRAGDYGPMVSAFALALTARVANQTISCGFQNAMGASPGPRARFEFSGTVNTRVTCVSASSGNAADIQSTTVTLPNGSTTATQLRYEIDVSNNQVSFVISGVVVAVHQDHIPGPYDALTQGIQATNTGVAGGTVTANLDWIQFNNVDQLEITSGFNGEPPPVRVVSSTPATYAAAISALNTANLATDVFTITGSATKTIRIKHISLSGIATTRLNLNVLLIKRSTANAGGTSTTPAAVPFDSQNPTATAVVRAYTANPTTLGTAVGTLHSEKCAVLLVDELGDQLEFETFTGAQDITLRGASEVLAVNFNGTTVAGDSFNIGITWTEE